MKVVFDISPILQPKSGIPIYCSHLARALSAFGEIELHIPLATLRFAHHRIMKDLCASLCPPATSHHIYLPGRIADRFPGISKSTCFPPIKDMDLLHAPSFMPYSWMSALNLPVVVTVLDLAFLHDPKYGHPASVPELRRNLPRACETADAILCISEYVRREVIDLFNINPHKVFVSHLGPQWEQPVTKGFIDSQKAKDDRKYFLYVSTIQPRKNLLALLEAFDSFSQNEPEAILVIVGGKGWDSEKELMEIERLKDKIEWIPFCAEEKLQELYAGARAFFLMSWIEGFGIPCLEAMTCGCPVVYATGSSMDEIVEDAGVALKPDDIKGIIDAMEKLWHDDELCDKMGKMGLVQADKFSWEMTAHDTLAAYRYAVEHYAGRH